MFYGVGPVPFDGGRPNDRLKGSLASEGNEYDTPSDLLARANPPEYNNRPVEVRPVRPPYTTYTND